MPADMPYWEALARTAKVKKFILMGLQEAEYIHKACSK